MPQWMKSKTLWFSVSLAILGAIEIQSQVIPEQYRGEVLIAIAGISAVLRYVTTLPVNAK